MKTFNDDFSGKEWSAELQVSLDVTFRNPADKKLYKASLEISPETAMKYIIQPCIRKPFPFAELYKYTEEEKKALGVKKDWGQRPAPNAKQVLASLIETEVTQ